MKESSKDLGCEDSRSPNHGQSRGFLGRVDIVCSLQTYVTPIKLIFIEDNSFIMKLYNKAHLLLNKSLKLLLINDKIT